MRISNARSYRLRIAGKEYNVSSTDPEERVRRVAVYTDRKISEIGASSLLTKEAAAVIACLTVSDELLTAQDDNTRLRRELAQCRRELQQYQQHE